MKKYVLIIVLTVLSTGCGRTILELQTENFLIGINSDARISSMLDKVSGREYLAEGEDAPLVSLVVDGEKILPSGLRVTGNEIKVTFPGGQDTVLLQVIEKPTHIVFEAAEVASGGHLDMLIWGPYPTLISEVVGECVGVVRDGNYAIGLQGLNMKTLGGYPVNDDDSMPSFNIFEGNDYSDIKDSEAGKELYRGNTASITDFGSTVQAYCRNRDEDRVILNLNHERYLARAFDDGGPAGSKIALFGCPPGEALDTIGEIEIEEGLPHPEIDGEWGKKYRGATASYLIIDFGEDTLEEALEITERAGLSYLYHGGPFETWGHFKLKKKQFPDNWDSLKRCVEKADEKGIRLGVHTLSNFITTNDPYVTPVPDKRLGSVGSSLLAADIDDMADEIEIADPGFFNQFENNNLRTVRIADELIRYKGVTSSSPWKLTGCRRGAFQTRASAHAQGDEIYKLVDHGYKTFLAGMDMQQEVAERIADLFNYTGLRQISFDGLEGCKSSGMGQYARTLFVNSWYQALNDGLRGRVINDASNPGHYFWHIYTRMNWGEPWYAGFRESQTQYRLKNQNFYDRNLMPHMLGWFNMTEQTSIEDAEWLLARAAGFDAGFALATSPEKVGNNGMGQDILTLISEWERARQLGAFSEEQKARMKLVSNEFHLEKTGADSWDLFSVESGKFVHGRKVRQPGEPLFSTFSYTCRGDAQPLQFIITASGGDLANLSMEIDNSWKVEIPGRLKDGEILKYSGGRQILKYNAAWQETGRLPVNEKNTMIDPGSHIFNIDCDFENGENPEVKLEIRTFNGPEKLKVFQK